MDKNIHAAVIGGSGLTGLELIKLLSNHSYTELVLVTSNTYKGQDVSEVFPSFSKLNKSGNGRMVYRATGEIDKVDLEHLDVVFLCLPPLESMAFVKKNLLKFKGVIIDIGSDFRINNPDDFKTWYGKEHDLKDAIPEFVYGLPEIYRDNIKKSRRVANPGCYPTSVILALAPVLSGKVYQIADIVIDTKSGVSGAGRKLKNEYLYCGVNENFFAYSAAVHRHIGEIEQEFKKLSTGDMKVCFTPHLLPVNRGIFTSIYCRITGNRGNKTITEEIIDSYRNYYRGCRFIRVLGEKVPQLKDVTGTNNCHIGIVYDERTEVLKVFSIIDNLLKGAAGQAVQNMNLIFNFDEGEALNGQGIFS